MMFIVPLIFLAKAESINTFPFFPIIINRYKRGIIQNYFDMNHICDKSSHGKILKKIVSDLKQNVSVGYNIDKLEQLVNLKNGNAAFILGIINEFGLFGNEIDDIKAARYYIIGSKYQNLECKSSLAYYYRYGIGGLESDMQKAKQLTKESMERCIFSALRIAMIFYEENKIDKAISVILPIATLTINNSTFFDFFYNADHEIKKFDGLSLPTKFTESESGDYLQALSNIGNYNAKLQLIQKALGNREYDRAVELVTDDYSEIEMAETTLKTEEEIERFDKKYGSYYAIIGMMKKYGIKINTIKKDNESNINTEKTSILKNKPKIINKGHSLTSNQLIEKAFRIGDPLAFTEIAYFYLTRGNEKAAEIGKSLLMAAVNISYIPAIHAYGVNLLNGWKPFIKDINLAKQCFIQCYKEKKYLPSMLNLALILQAYENNPEKAFLILNELVEYSFLFSDSQKAYKATVDGNYQLSLQYYKRLADAGSSNASFNVYQLYKQNSDLLNQNVEEKYFNKYKNYYDFDKNDHTEQKQENIDDIRKKWLVESSPDAYYENGEQLLKEGKDIQKAIECFKRGSKSNGYSAFKAGMLIMKENPEESLSYFNRAQNLKKMLKWAVTFMKTRIFIENIPYLFKNRYTISNILFHRNEMKYIEPFDLFMANCTFRILNVLSFVVPFLVMYFLIIIRFKITNSNEHFVTIRDQQFE